jgi:excinuclease ABC subunit C
MTQATLQQALSSKLLTGVNAENKLAALQEALGLPETPRHIECFDISHTRGEKTVASCVVFIDGVAEKASYRYFNIEGIEPGDDYAAIRQAISRRFARLKKGEGKMPNLLLIDGGQGQLAQGIEVLQVLGIDSVRLAAVAKGPGRKPGLEQILLPGHRSPLILPADSPALHLIQQIRDEAHRFAIGGHRRQREKARTQSTLDGIPGLGSVRKQALLRALGGVRQISRSSVSELARVEGISLALAQRIYDYFHE